MANENIGSTGAIAPTSYLDYLYVKENPPIAELQTDNSAVVITGTVTISSQEYLRNSVDGDTLLVKQSQSDSVKITTNEGNSLRVRLIGIDAPEVQHKDADGDDIFQCSDRVWRKVKDLTGVDKISYDSEKQTYPFGESARDYVLSMIGIDIAKLRKADSPSQTSKEITLVIDRTQFGTEEINEGSAKIMRQPGMDIYGRYLGVVYTKHPKTGDSLNLNKSLLIQNFKTVPLMFYDKNNEIQLSPVFKVQDYSTLYTLFNNDLEENDKSKSGATASNAVDDRLAIANHLGLDSTGKEDWITVLGDSIFFLPPTNLSVSKNVKSERFEVVRSKNSIDRGTGHSDIQLNLQLYFSGEDMINGYPILSKLPNGEYKTYHMNGLRQLIAQFRKTPFLPITNKEINFSYNIEAVSLVSMNISTVEGYPALIRADLILEDFEPRTYLIGLDGHEGFDGMFDWPLFRYYYQKSFEASEEAVGHTFLKPVPSQLDGKVTFSLIKDDQLHKLSQEAALVAWNKISASKRAGEVKDVSDYMLELGYPQAANDNYLSYKSTINTYADFLKYYNNEKANGNNDDPEDILKKYLKEYNLTNSNVFVRNTDGITQFFMNVSLTLPFYYLSRDNDYILSDTWYKASYKERYLGNNLINYSEKLNYHNDFLFHKDFNMLHVNDSYVKIESVIDKREDSFIGKTVFAIMSAGDAFNDRIISNYSQTSPAVIAPDNLKFYVSPKELYIEGLITDQALLNAHTEICNKLEGNVRDRMVNVVQNVVNKGLEYAENLSAAKDETSKAQQNADKDNLQKLQSQNFLDDLNLEFQALDILDSPTSINIGMSNTFANLQLLSLPTPTKQYMGGTDTVIQLNYTVQGKDTLAKFNYLFEYSTHLVRKYRSYISDGFIKIDNELVNMMGVNYVVINSMDAKQVPDYPGWYNITMTLVAFDRTQRNKEELKKLAQGNEEDLGTNSGDKIVNAETGTYQRLIEALKSAEVYPDLELPTNHELVMKGFNINLNGGKFPDPDFYISYNNRFLFASTVQEQIVNPTNLGNAIVFDANTGDSAQFSFEKPLNGLEQNESLKASVSEVEKQIGPKESSLVDSAAKEGGIEVRFAKDDTLNEQIAGSIVQGSSSVSNSEYYSSSQGFLGMTFALAQPYDGKSDNIEKIKTSINIPSGFHAITNEGVGQDISRDKTHEYIESLCDLYGVVKDNVVRGIIHNLIEAESDAYHWATYDTTTGTHIAKGLNKAYTDASQFGTATRVGVSQLNLSDATYSNDEKEMLIQNPLANLQYGLSKLARKYLETFSMSGHGLYSKMEYNKGSDSEGSTTAPSTSSDPYAELSKEEMAYITMNGSMPAPINSDLDKIGTRDYWYGSGKGATEPVMKVFINLNKNKVLVDKAIADTESTGKTDNTGYNKLKGTILELVYENSALGKSQKVSSSRVPVTEEAKVAAAGGMNVLHNGGAIDISFERARWMAASFMYSGFSLTANEYSAIYQYVAGGFSLNAIAASGIGGDFKAAINVRFRKMKEDTWSAKVLLGGGSATYSLGDLIKTESTQSGVETFGDFNGDPAFVVRNEDIFKNSLNDEVEFDKRGRLSRAFPTFFICIIDEGNSIFNWKLHDNFYGYNAINEINVIRSRKMAASTCTMSMSNMFNTYWNWDDDSMYRRKSTFSEVYDSIFNTEDYVKGTASKLRNADTGKSMIKAGARLHVRMGYSSNVRSMPICFNGTITEVEQGDIIQIVAQGDGIELINKIPASPKETVGTSSSVEEKDVLERIFDSVTGGTSEPRNVILDMFHNKGGFWKQLIYKLSDGVFFNKNGLGIVHFGNPEFKLIFNEGGEVAQNVYAGMNPVIIDNYGEKTSVIAFEDSANIFSKSDEPNFSMYLYNKTPWDIIQVCRMLIPDFIASVEPFEFRSTLFYGKPYYPFAYEYDYANMDLKLVEEQLSKVVAPTEVTTTSTTSFADYRKIEDTPATGTGFSGLEGILAGKESIYMELGQKYAVDPILAAAIAMHETGKGTSPALKNHNNPAGVMDWENNWKTIRHFNSLYEGIEYAIKNVLKKNFIDKGLTTIETIGPKYAPIGAKNDPNNLNQYWIPNVTAFYKKLSGGAAAPMQTTQEIITKTRVLTSYLDANGKSPLKEKRKTFQQLHMFSSFLDILDNKIKASERGVYTAVIGNFIGQKALQSQGTYQTPVIYADTDIWEEKQKTAMVDCQLYAKGVPILGLIPFVNKTATYFTDQSKAINIATAALQDYLKDMYQGEMVILGYPSIKPYDIMSIDDQYNEMKGLCEVQQVVQMFSVRGGFTTSVTPDACVTQHDQHVKNKWVMSNSVAPILYYAGARLTAAFLAVKVLGFTRLTVGFASKFASTGYGQYLKVADFISESDTIKSILEHSAKMKESVQAVADAKISKGVKEETSKMKKYLDDILEVVSSKGKTLKEVGEETVKHTDDFIKAARIGSFAFAAVELAAVFMAEKALITWVKRYIRNRQAVSMTLLRQHGKELSAGINGHRGLVVGDTPGVMDSVVKSLFGSAAAGIILDESVREIANTTYDSKKASVTSLDSTYSDQYRSDYIKQCETSLGEMASLMAGSDNMSAMQVSKYINADSTGTTSSVPSYYSLVNYAQSLLGSAYVWGGHGEILTKEKVDSLKGTSHFSTKMYDLVGKKGFDCSGYVQEVYGHFNIKCSGPSSNQIKLGREVSQDELKPGDLIFFGTKTKPYHVIMYIGDGKTIEAPQSGGVVCIKNVRKGIMARRIVENIDSLGVETIKSTAEGFNTLRNN